MDLYWISSSISLRNTTAPDVVARVLPTSKAWGVTCRGSPSLCSRSSTRWLMPRIRLVPPELNSSLTASGLSRVLEGDTARSEEHTSELQSLMRISYAVFCLKKKKNNAHRTKQRN